jgi:hypothetical protein
MKVAMNDEPKLDIEAIRASYRPKRITTLFVGESAPKSGKCFYCGNTALGRYMRNVMEKAGLKIDGNFLECSKVMGWYDGGGHVRCLCRIARTRNARGGLTHQCNIVVEVSASCHKMPCLPKRLLKFSGTMNPVKEDEKLWDAQEPAMKEWLIQAGLAGMQYLELFPQFAKQFIEFREDFLHAGVVDAETTKGGGRYLSYWAFCDFSHGKVSPKIEFVPFRRTFQFTISWSCAIKMWPKRLQGSCSVISSGKLPRLGDRKPKPACTPRLA